ncbi:fumarate reductase subunit FrdD [Orbaceae bacterium ac157xtp]
MNQNEKNQIKRSDEPVFWSLFSAGGTWAAIFAPVIIVILAFTLPFGDYVTRSYILKLMTSVMGKLFLLFMISLPIWCALHRILHSLHDLNIYPRRGKLLTYGLALAWTAHTIYILFLR